MADEADAYMQKAHRSLANARKILAAGVHEDAGRAAYIAVFSAAEALIFAKTGEIAKTHNGVNAKFHELTKDDVSLDMELRRFLSRAYRLKEIADYEVGDSSILPFDYAVAAIETAARFLAYVSDLLGYNHP